MVAVAVAAYSYEEAAAASTAQKMVEIDHLQGRGKGGVEIEA